MGAEPTISFTPSEIVSLAIAGAAFLLSILTLYLTNLKRAEIEATTLPDNPPVLWSDGGWASETAEGRWPRSLRLRFPMVAYNVGARTGVLTRIILTRIREVPATDPLFLAKGPTPMLLQEANEAFEAGTLRIYSPNVNFDLDSPTGDVGLLRERLAKKEAIELSVTFRYLKGRTKRSWPHRHGGITKETTLDITVPLKDFSAAVAGGD